MLLTNRVFIPGSARLLQVPAAINEQQQIQVVAGLKNYNYKRKNVSPNFKTFIWNELLLP